MVDVPFSDEERQEIMRLVLEVTLDLKLGEITPERRDTLHSILRKVEGTDTQLISRRP